MKKCIRDEKGKKSILTALEAGYLSYHKAIPFQVSYQKAKAVIEKSG